jgi:hypothetical protein
MYEINYNDNSNTKVLETIYANLEHYISRFLK